MLKRRGAVIFDFKEDIPQDILTKPYIPQLLRQPVSVDSSRHPDDSPRFDGVVAATPFIRDNFRPWASVVLISIIFQCSENSKPRPDGARSSEVCYVGSLTVIRGIVEMVKAMGLVQSGARLNLGGQLKGTNVEAPAQREAGWERVNALGSP